MKFCPLFAFYWSNVFSALSDVDGIFVSRSTFSPRSSSHLGCFPCWLTSAAAAYSTTRRVCSSSLGFSLADRLSYNSTFRLAIIMKLWGSIPILLVAILTLAAVTGKHFLSFFQNKRRKKGKGEEWVRLWFLTSCRGIDDEADHVATSESFHPDPDSFSFHYFSTSILWRETFTVYV